jgi:hypothetical protein
MNYELPIFGKVYLVTHKASGKMYVGATARKVRARLVSHLREPQSPLIHRALNKYGLAAFDVRVVDTALTRAELFRKEAGYVKFYDCKSPKGYNLTDGGEDPGPEARARGRATMAAAGWPHLAKNYAAMGGAEGLRALAAKGRAMLGTDGMRAIAAKARAALSYEDFCANMAKGRATMGLEKTRKNCAKARATLTPEGMRAAAARGRAVRGPEGLRRATAKGRHARWHTRRGIVNQACEFCRNERGPK